MKEILFNPLIIGLLLSISLLFGLLLIHFVSNERVSKKLEIFVDFMVLFSITGGSLPPFDKVDPSALAGEGKTFSSSVVQLSIYAFAVFLLRSRFQYFFQNSMLVFKDPFLTLILLISFLSAFWSETPIVTLKYSLVIIAMSLFAVHVAKRYNLQQWAALLRWFCAIVLIISVLIAIAVPSIGVHSKGWQGILSFPIRLGTFAALGAALWFCRVINTRKNRKLGIGIILISLLALIRANSAQAFLVLMSLISIAMIPYAFKHLKFRQATVASILFFTTILCFFAFLIYHSDAFFAAFGKDASLTGRTDFWPQIVAALNHKNPLLGFGVHGFWQPWRGDQNPARHIITANEFIPPNAHSGFLDLAVETGYIGLFLFICMFLKISTTALIFAGKSQASESIVPLILIVYIFMANVSETQLFADTYLWFILVYLAIWSESAKITSIDAKKPA